MKRVVFVCSIIICAALLSLASGCGGGTEMLGLSGQPEGDDVSVDEGTADSPLFLNGEEEEEIDVPVIEKKGKEDKEKNGKDNEETGEIPTCNLDGLPEGKVGVSYSGEIAVEGWSDQYALSLSMYTKLPEGFSIVGTTISGMSSKAGNWNVKLFIKDADTKKTVNNCTGSIRIIDDSVKIVATVAESAHAYVTNSQGIAPNKDKSSTITNGGAISVKWDAVIKIEIQGNDDAYDLSWESDDAKNVCVGAASSDEVDGTNDPSCPGGLPSDGKKFFIWLKKEPVAGANAPATWHGKPIGTSQMLTLTAKRKSSEAKESLAIEFREAAVEKKFVATPTEVAAIGGFSGAPFKDSCPDGEAVTRINLRSGLIIDQIQISCEPLETISGVPVKPTARETHGQDGGDPHEIAASTGFAFIGFEAKANASNITRLKPIAQRVYSWGLMDAYDWDGGAFGKGEDGKDSSIRCGSGEVLTGIHGTSGAYLNSLGLICTKITTGGTKPTYVFGKNGNEKDITKHSPGGGSCPISCVDDTHPDGGVIVGFNYKVGSCGGNSVLIEINLKCGVLQQDGLAGPNTWDSAGKCGNGDGGKDWHSYDIPEGHAIVGIKHNDGDRLDSIQVISTPPAFLFDMLYPKVWPEADAFPVNSPKIGGDGGGDRGESMCDAHQVLSGIEFASGSGVDDVIGYTCTPVVQSVKQ